MKVKTLLISLTLIFALILSSCADSNLDENDKNEISEIIDEITENVNLASFGLGDSTGYYGDLFGQGNITEINIDISEEDWADMCQNAAAEEYHSANITINGVLYQNVGFRTKGQSSLSSVSRTESNRYGFRVKMNKYVSGQKVNGLDDFVLNASYSDPSYMREYLTYAASAALGTVTPFVTFTKLSINGEYFGFYLCIEAYDGSFVKRVANNSDTAQLYKADGQNCTLTSSDNLSGFELKYGEDDGKASLNALKALINKESVTKEELEALLDVDSFLKAFAINTVLGNYDSYSGSMAHNYFLLYDNGIFRYIGWDYNMSIGGFMNDSGSSVAASVDEPIYGVQAANRPLIIKLLSIDEFKDRYYGYIDQLVAYFEDIGMKIETILTVIDEYVKEDPTAFYTYEQFIEAISDTGTDLSQYATDGNMSFGGNMGGFVQRGNFEIDGEQAEGDFQMPTRDQNRQNNGGMQGGGFAFGGNMPSNVDPNAVLPEGNGELPEGFDAENFDFFGGELPEGFDAENFDPNNAFIRENVDISGRMGGGMFSPSTCSIFDYITQRIENIKQQRS